MALTDEQKKQLIAKMNRQNGNDNNENIMEPMIMNTWYIRDEDGMQGPFSDSDMMDLIKGGFLKKSTMVRKNGQGWLPAYKTELGKFINGMNNGSSVTYVNVINQNPSEYVQQHTNGMAIASLVCCLVGLVFMGWLLETLAIIFGAVGVYQCSTNPERYSGKGMAICGLVTGIISLVAEIVFAVFAINAVTSIVRDWFTSGV